MWPVRLQAVCGTVLLPQRVSAPGALCSSGHDASRQVLLCEPFGGICEPNSPKGSMSGSALSPAGEVQPKHRGDKRDDLLSDASCCITTARCRLPASSEAIPPPEYGGWGGLVLCAGEGSPEAHAHACSAERVAERLTLMHAPVCKSAEAGAVIGVAGGVR